jgi:SSS family solute:Na+ symporter
MVDVKFGNLYALDWIIIIGAVVALRVFSYSTKKYMRSVADFLSANRSAGRYLLTISSAMGGIGVVSIVAQFEVFDRAGFAPGWWGGIFIPISIILSMTGWVVYRFRETRALTMAQFFEMRYNRKFRSFAGLVCFASGIINFGIFPAVAARFIIYYCGLPASFHPIPGVEGIILPTYPVLMAIDLGLALSFVNMGGQISVMITDCVQGLFAAVAFIVIAAWIYLRFSWNEMVTAVNMASAPGKSMLNPFDTSSITDFNIWFYLIGMFSAFYTVLAWQGSQGFFSSARTPHEQKMGTIIAGWRAVPQNLALTLMSIATVAVFRLPEFADTLTGINKTLQTIPNEMIQGQMKLPLAMAAILPIGVKGLLCTIMIFISFTCHDTYLHSWGSIFVQDVYMPIKRKKLTMQEHIRLLRIAITGVAIFGYVFSLLYPPDQPILMFFAVTGAIWLGGAGSVIIGGLYWPRGTTAGAYSAVITGGVIGLIGVFIPGIYKNLTGHQFPINGQYINMIAMSSAVLMYVSVSLITGRGKPAFNLDKLLHRGNYAIKNEHTEYVETLKSRWQKFVGITPEFSKSDKIFALFLIGWNLLLFLWFIIFTAINLYYKLVHGVLLSDNAWSIYWQVGIVINVILCIPVTIWFTVGGIIDIKALYKHLDTCPRDHSDDGSVCSDEDEEALALLYQAAGVSETGKAEETNPNGTTSRSG